MSQITACGYAVYVTHGRQTHRIRTNDRRQVTMVDKNYCVGYGAGSQHGLRAIEIAVMVW